MYDQASCSKSVASPHLHEKSMVTFRILNKNKEKLSISHKINKNLKFEDSWLRFYSHFIIFSFW